MPSSGSRSPSAAKNRRKSSGQKKKGSNRSASSGSSRSSKSSRSRNKRSQSRDNNKDGGRFSSRRDNEKPPQSAKLFVTNIDSKFSQDELNKDLRALFEPFGKIKEIVIKTKQGSSNSYVFVEYEDVESATKAQIDLKNIIFKGKQLKVQFGRGQRKNQDRKSDKCYICHKEGHFAKDCRYNKFINNGNQDSSRYRKDHRDDYRGKDRDGDRDRDRRHRRRDSRSPSRSSSSRSYRKRYSRDRDDYRRRDYRRSPQKKSDYHSRRH